MLKRVALKKIKFLNKSSSVWPQVRLRVSNAGTCNGFASSEEAVPHVGAFRGHRSLTGERARDI